MPERLQKILSAQGVASRREAERFILAGRVTVNGATAALGQSAEFGRDDIAVDGVPVRQGDKPVYIMLNKPRGYVTTVSDERGRKTVMELVADAGARVYPVGRLDMDSEGLLLMTNDGSFADAVMHPSHMKRKTYEAHVRGDAAAAIELLRRPMEIGGREIKAASVEAAGRTASGAIVRITIFEGRNRQVRKMCEQCGLNVRLLRRVSIGAVELGSLGVGQWRRLSDEERKSLRDEQ